MTRWMAAFIIFATVCAQASDDHQSSMQAGIFCSDSWYRFIDDILATSDNQGHGPDVGSDEWKSVIEFKLGIRGEPDLPDRDSEAWRRHIDQIVRKKGQSSPENNEDSNETVISTGPSYDCDKVEANSIEELICKDNDLAALDRKLSVVYSASAKKASNEHPPMR